jgi:hypothetical protein
MNQFYFDAIYAVYSNAVTINSDSIVFDSMDNVIDIDQNVISNKIAELQAAEPLRLLRIERNRLLQETDWRFRIDQEPSQAWYEYCQALRDLPTTAEPQLDENGQLTNVIWPVKPSESV